uniref:ATP synthase F0 subunit 8 n=1 Tax=Bungarus multicinctus TaxID=8616 RepID=B6CWK1_BUNMU|nr:ATP synthase F0 subunit 8 [Bungarus multicinctus]
MPQLSTIYIFLIFSWTWLMLCLIMQKINTILMNKDTKLYTKPINLSPILPWT